MDAGAIDRVIEFTKTYEIGQMDFDQYEVFYLSLFKDLKADVLRDSLAGYLELVRSHIRPEVYDRLKEHRAHGRQDPAHHLPPSIFLSRPYREPGRCGRPDSPRKLKWIPAGCPTGKVIGVDPLSGDESGLCWMTWLRENGCTLEDSWGYSDSCNDLPLLQKVAHPVVVVPDKILREYALEHDWEILVDGGSAVPKEFNQFECRCGGKLPKVLEA